MNDEQQVFLYLGVALAIGLLIGVERGWHERAAKEGGRIAGVRTFGLIGLLGGGVALLGERFGPLIVGMVFVGLALALALVYVANLRRGRDDVGITSLVAGLVTFVLGALAAMGEIAVAGAAAVITTLLLSYKPLLHRWIGALEADELRAGVKLLLISVVLLPVLPDRGYGPWQALNPYTIWWMVVLIAAISFVGYFAVRIAGARRGILFTGAFGGLSASTALTLHFSRLSSRNPALAPTFAVGILVACGTMFPRMLLVASLIAPPLFEWLLVPSLVMAAFAYLPALVYWYRQMPREEDVASPLKNPLELKTALSFGLLLALVMLLGRALQEWLGEIGVLALAAASGVADVDAITLSLARMSQGDLAPRIAASGIVIAAAVNSAVKGVMASAIGGRAIGLRAAAPLFASAGAGLLTVWWWVW
ncbi:MAG: MgtC/SapB family protein [Chromatiales bacterium]|nr:MgtC/SapB family protein [Chromatiales bacterium]